MAKIITIILAFCSLTSAEYTWVLPSSHIQTSSFGEFRVGHFHGGIDIRAPVGMPLVAPADGWIQRIIVSPWGYGKALFFVYDDTLTSVFGHLSRFSGDLQKQVVNKHYSEKAPKIDIWFKKNEYPFKAGEIIAYTGKTGVGKPHLHFETRRGLDTYLSPHALGFAPPDSMAPIICKVSITPLSQDAWIEESLRPLLIEPGDDYWRRKCAVRFQGQVGVAVALFDRTGPENMNRMGVKKLELILDNETIFCCSYDYFMQSEMREIGFLYDGGLEAFFGSRFHKMFVPKSVDIMPLNSNEKTTGILDFDLMTPAIHELRLRFEDFCENVSECTLKIVPSPIEEVTLQFAYNQSGKSIVEVLGESSDLSIQFCPTGSSVFKTIATNEKSIPVDDRSGFFKLSGLGTRQVYPFLLGTIDEQSYRSEKCSLFAHENFLYYIVELDVSPKCVPDFAIFGISFEYEMLTPRRWLLRHSSAELEEQSIPRVEIFLGDPEFPFAIMGEFNPMLCLMGFWTERSDSGKLWKASLRISGDALNETMPVYNWYESAHGKDVASMLFHFLPRWLYFREHARIIFDPTSMNLLPDDTLDKLCIVRWWRDNWYYVPGQRTGRQFIAKVRALGSFALMWDNEPPQAGLLSTSADTITISITDNLSGFGAQNIPQVFIDDKWTLVEYDPEDDMIFVLPKSPISTEKHTLKLIAADRAKNKIEETWDFQIK